MFQAPIWTRKQPKTYYDLKRAGKDKRVLIFQGGARSGKTYSILQVLIEFCMENMFKGLTITIVRKTLPALRESAMKDFLDILKDAGLYSEKHHNKSNFTYNLFGNQVEFLGLDQAQKVRGRKRHICFINEANELTEDDFKQLIFRTTFRMILDFNPSDEFSWIYDLEMRDDAELFVSNFTHNPHLDPVLVKELLRLEGADEDYWNVFGLGLRGKARNLIITHWKLVDEMPTILDDHCYGQDFGFNVPSALIKTGFLEDSVYWDEIIHAPKLITADLIDLYEQRNVSQSDAIWCDHAAADSIEELQRAGYNALKANKDVTEGLNKIRSAPLYITKRSINLIKELSNYKYMLDKATQKPTDQPLKFNDHGIDAGRYGTYSHKSGRRRMRSHSA